MFIENDIQEEDNFIITFFYGSLNKISNISFYLEDSTIGAKNCLGSVTVGRWQRKGYQEENGKHTDKFFADY